MTKTIKTRTFIVSLVAVVLAAGVAIFLVGGDDGGDGREATIGATSDGFELDDLMGTDGGSGSTSGTKTPSAAQCTTYLDLRRSGTATQINTFVSANPGYDWSQCRPPATAAPTTAPTTVAPTTAPTPAPAAVTTTIVSGTPVKATSAAPLSTTAKCPSTSTLVGGGARVIQSGTATGYVSQTFPATGGKGGSWLAQMTVKDFVAGTAQPTIQAWALCQS